MDQALNSKTEKKTEIVWNIQDYRRGKMTPLVAWIMLLTSIIVEWHGHQVVGRGPHTSLLDA